MRIAAYTSFTFSYLSRALVLAQTLRAAHPDWAIHACIVDTPPEGIDLSAQLAAFDHVVYAPSLPIPRFQAWIFKHDLVEACTAVKGHMLAHLLAAGYDRVFYFDPDIAIFHPLHSVLARLDRASILLTPHQAEPSRDYAAFRDNEMTSLRYGIFNLGFLGVRNSPVGRAFADWWAGLLYEACYDDPANGLFTDQRYLDLAPALFDEVEVLRDPGCNLASWNLSNRSLAINRDGNITVNGAPLKFYHFTKINGVGDVMTEKYLSGNSAIWEVWTWYKRQIAERESQAIPKGYWHYGQFSNGTPIAKPMRITFRTRTDLMGHFDDPFAMQPDGYYAWMCNESPDLIIAA